MASRYSIEATAALKKGRNDLAEGFQLMDQLASAVGEAGKATGVWSSWLNRYPNLPDEGPLEDSVHALMAANRALADASDKVHQAFFELAKK